MKALGNPFIHTQASPLSIGFALNCVSDLVAMPCTSRSAIESMIQYDVQNSLLLLDIAIENYFFRFGDYVIKTIFLSKLDHERTWKYTNGSGLC
jgi:hypothetical protein